VWLFSLLFLGKVGSFMGEGDRSYGSAPAIANPGPLGLSAFALTTFVLSAANAGLFTGSAIVLGLALFYGGLTQFCAGMWEFRTGNVFGATAFSSYGGFWISLGFALLPLFGSKSLVELAGGAQAVGVFLLGWTIFTGLMLVATLRVSLAHILLFLCLFLTFLFLTMGALQGAADMSKLGGWLGLVTAGVAWYIALAGVLSATRSPIQLPVFSLS
jgi:succinate-acetate transporter protein